MSSTHQRRDINCIANQLDTPNTHCPVFQIITVQRFSGQGLHEAIYPETRSQEVVGTRSKERQNEQQLNLHRQASSDNGEVVTFHEKTRKNTYSEYQELLIYGLQRYSFGTLRHC